jgi:hypothetical protein
MVQIVVNSPNADGIADHLLRAVPDYIAPAQKAAVTGIMLDIQERMQEPGAQPTSPIRWDSPRQRAAFFASNGFGGGIPHKRTGEYTGGWKIEILPDGVKMYNTTQAAPFVGGNPFGTVYSGIHVGRWNNWGQVGAEEMKRLPDLLQQADRNSVQAFLSERG